MSFAFDLAWLDAVLGRINGERGLTLVVGALVLASAFYLHLLCGVFLIAGSLIALLCLLAVDARRSATESRRWVRDVGAMALAAALVALSDTPEMQRADSDGPAAEGCAAGDAFNTKILALARGFAEAPPPDFAKASFAELFAWSLAQPPAE